MVTVPGPYKILGEIDDYRSRSNLNESIPKNVVRNAFLTFSESAVDKFLNANVAACVMSMIIEASTEEQAIDIVDKNLGPIELDGITEITTENSSLIEQIMGDAISSYPPRSLDA